MCRRISKLVVPYFPCPSFAAIKFITRLISYLLLSLLFTHSLQAKTLHYLYINASEGSASGGHTALRFTHETYHFQHYSGGTIRLVKDISADFDFQYRYIENRTLHQTHIELPTEQYDQLRDYFNLRFLRQKQQDSLLKEINLNLAFLDKQNNDPLLIIKGAGLFSKITVPRETFTYDPTIIKQKISSKLGATFVSSKITELTQKLKTLKPEAWPEQALLINEHNFISIPYSFAQQYINTLSQLLFLQTLRDEHTLNAINYFSPEHKVFDLSVIERQKLTHLQKQLIQNLLSLLDSKRPDWATPAFILYARIISLSYSIHSGKWVFLDTFLDNSPSISYQDVKNYEATIKAQQRQALKNIILAKEDLFTLKHTITESEYSHFERRSNYYYERERSLNKQQGMRVFGDQRLPSKSAPIPEHLLATLPPTEAHSAKTRLLDYQAKVQQQIQSLYKYDLFTRNCVTEIFTGISKAKINSKQLNNLLKLIDQDPASFIPFRSFSNISATRTQQKLPSFRQQQLKKMCVQESSLQVYLRESNTISAQDYKFNNGDTPFLFFTNEQTWLRPLFGAANLLTATSVGLYGGLSWPFDSGAALQKGSMGILMSLPELAFFNIRKGSYQHLPFPEFSSSLSK